MSSWPIEPSGLTHDREWTLLDSTTGNAMSQKRWPRMVLIRPRIDRAKNEMTVSAPGMIDLVVDMSRASDSTDGKAATTAATCDTRVCGDVVTVTHVSADADEWFSTFLNHPCELHRVADSSDSGDPTGRARRHAHSHSSTSGPPQPLLLSNESPFLLISASSVQRVNDWVAQETTHQAVLAACFRANFEISGSDDLAPFAEDDVEFVKIGRHVFQALGPCRRCLMVSINQVCSYFLPLIHSGPFRPTSRLLPFQD